MFECFPAHHRIVKCLESRKPVSGSFGDILQRNSVWCCVCVCTTRRRGGCVNNSRNTHNTQHKHTLGIRVWFFSAPPFVSFSVQKIRWVEKLRGTIYRCAAFAAVVLFSPMATRKARRTARLSTCEDIGNVMSTTHLILDDTADESTWR